MRITPLLLLFVACFRPAADEELLMKSVQKNGVTVTWEHQNSRIFFEMTAPTDGWVAIGFNTSQDITGNYLLMGQVVDGKPKVTEHYTLSPGYYEPFSAMKVAESVTDVEGTEVKGKTTLKFSVPVVPANSYAKRLDEGTSYVLLLAYSQEDDFQHHSMMRTSMRIQL